MNIYHDLGLHICMSNNAMNSCPSNWTDVKTACTDFLLFNFFSRVSTSVQTSYACLNRIAQSCFLKFIYFNLMVWLNMLHASVKRVSWVITDLWLKVMVTCHYCLANDQRTLRRFLPVSHFRVCLRGWNLDCLIWKSAIWLTSLTAPLM